MKSNQALKQSLVTMEKVFESDCLISFLARKLPLQFSPKPLNHFVSFFYLIMFSSPCSFQWYIICGFSSHGSTITIFEFWTMEKPGYCSEHCSNGHFLIWSLTILIFNWRPQFAGFLISLLLLNYFSKFPLSKLHQNLLKNFFKYKKIYGNFYLPFCPLVKYRLIFNA
jgi:hypothetical protein